MGELLPRDVFLPILTANKNCFDIVFNIIQVSRWLSEIVSKNKDEIAEFYCESRYDKDVRFRCLPNGLKHGTLTRLVEYCSYSAFGDMKIRENYSYGNQRGHQFDKVYDSGDGLMERTDRWYGGDDGKNITTINRDYDYDDYYVIRISNSQTKNETISIKITNNMIKSVKCICSVIAGSSIKHYIPDSDWPINTEFETLLKWSKTRLPVDSK